MQTTSLKEIGLLRLGNNVMVSGMILVDGDTTLLVPIPEEQDSVAQGECKLVNLTAEEYIAFIRQLDVVEVEIFDRAANTKVLVRKSQRQLDARIAWKVFQRDNYTCRYCGVTGVPMTYDHLMLWEDGGPTTEENGVAACKKCNKTRGNTWYGSWLVSDYYRKVCLNLTLEQRLANSDLESVVKYMEKRISKRKR